MKKVILTGALLLISHFVYSQTTIAPSGGTVLSNGGTSTYTIGQLVYETYNQNNGSIAQGVQHAFEIQVLSSAEFLSEKLTLLTYPNPTSSNLVLKVSSAPIDKLEYTLFDILGKQILGGIITKKETTIKIQYISNGVYFLKVTKNKQLLKSLKIIKK